VTEAKRPPTGPAGTSTGRTDAPWVALTIAAALAFTLVCLDSARLETPTVDEFAHVPAGSAYLRHGTFELYAKNPPLMQLLLAVPLIGRADVPVPEARDLGLGWGPWRYGTRFMEANESRYLDLFLLARGVAILAGLACGGLIFAWLRRSFDVRAAALSTTTFWLMPMVLAHAHLATVDMGCALTILLTVGLARRAMLRPGWIAFVATGVAFGAALLVKFTALLLAPALVIVFAIVLRRTPGRALLGLGTVGVFALGVVNVGMGFDGAFQRLDAYSLVSESGKGMQQALPGGLPVPVPEAWLVGFDAVKRDTEQGEFGSYLLGEWSKSGWWYYDAVALGVKTPIPVLLLLLLVPWSLRRAGLSGAELACLLMPPLVLGLMMSGFNRVQIGVRYLLPLVPFLCLLLGPVWVDLLRPRTRWLPAVAIGYLVVSAALSHPGHLAHFNVLAGGSAGGHRVLADSNLDWGQDLYRLEPELDRLGHTGPIGLLYFGHVRPALYGIDYQLVPPYPKPGIMAVSVNYLLGYPYPATAPDGQLVPIARAHVAWLRDREPVARAGTIWIFDTRG
jgi:hypothetical protein